MEPLPPIEDLASRIRASGVHIPAGRIRAATFGDSPQLSSQLLSLIRIGQKRGGASLLWAYEADAEVVPDVGDLEIVVDHRRNPCFVTRVRGVEVVAFGEVSAAFAACEGEGDGSLEFWRQAHWHFFSRECERIGRVPSRSMPVVCCSFDVLAAVPTADGEAPVHIEPYRSEWPALFEAEKSLLESVLSPWLAGPIEHVGSTAVRGMAAKPIIDIMAAVRSLEESRAAIGALERIQYCYAPYRPDVMHWFCKPEPRLRTHHLHLVPYESALWTERVAFRDRLRADSALAREYLVLKRRLAIEHANDREAYTGEKTPFIERALAR